MRTLVRPLMVLLVVVVAGLVLVVPVFAQDCTVENAGNSDVTKVSCELSEHPIADPGGDFEDTVTGTGTYSVSGHDSHGVVHIVARGETDEGLQASNRNNQNHNSNTGHLVDIWHLTREED